MPPLFPPLRERGTIIRNNYTPWACRPNPLFDRALGNDRGFGLAQGFGLATDLSLGNLFS
jgi:hypothetical protein